MADQVSGNGVPDAFARPGQTPVPQDPTSAQLSQFPAPDAGARPYDVRSDASPGSSYAAYTPPAAASGAAQQSPYAQQAPGQPYGTPYGQPYAGQAYAQQSYAQQPYGQQQYVQPAGGTQTLGGATAVGGRRRSGARGRLLAGVGALAAVAVLVTASGFGGGGIATTTPQTGSQPAASAPAQSGQSGSGQSGTSNGGSTGGQSGSGQTGTGAAASSTQTDATQAQSKGVVLINTTLTSGSAAGTGMVIDASGLVLTNYHVVQGSTKVEVTIASTDKTYTATVVGHDATNDVALLKLDGASGLDTVTIDDDSVAVGDTVSAVGNANGQDFLSAATGQITDTSATVTVSNDSASGSETLKDVYETNAAAQPGDSGGPLFDSETEVTGMTTAGEQTYRGPRSGQATTVTSYAIPIARALSIVKQIESGQETSTVSIGANAYLGIMVSTKSTSGSAVVSDVTAGTPAAKAGITAGSTLTGIGDTKVSSQAEIAAALAGLNPGDTVKVTWTDSSGETHSAQVTLAASPVN